MRTPSYCPKCGCTAIMSYGCSRRGFRRYGGVLNQRTERIPCRRNDYHQHWYCVGAIWAFHSGHMGCGHHWTTS